jgi:hypothetical protein
METPEINKMTKVLHHIAIREFDNDEMVDRYFKLLTQITQHLQGVLEYDDDKIKYDRSAWINRGSEEGWWSSPMDYEKDSDLESLAIQIAQMLKYSRIIKNN